jgi:predicted AAA+ superfamily ATPase
MKRNQYLKNISTLLRSFPIVAILGPRQCGKTTLARDYIKAKKRQEVHYFDLEDPEDLARLKNPKLTLSELSGIIVIDEIQRIPDLFSVLRVLVDKENNKASYLILGSASRELIKQTSESLAGRIAYLELKPFSFGETHTWKKLWLRGGFPLAYLAKNIKDSMSWRKFYIKTFLEQDIPNLGIQIPAQTLYRFWMMLTHCHGNILNSSELGRSFGVADTTIKRYLDILSGTFMIRQLAPWWENINKRQVKNPKIYFRDSGILHTMLGINNWQELISHPKLGASWEGIAIEEIIKALGAEQNECYFWAIHAQAELDLLIFKDSKRLGFEFKYTDKPQLTKSMQIAADVLKLDKLYLISPGKQDFPLAENIRAVGIEKFLTTY